MSSYAFLVQTCWKEHPDASINSSEFFRKCSESLKALSVKEKEKYEDTAKDDKARYEREMKPASPSKERPKRSSRAPMHPRGLLWPSSCSEYCSKIKGKHPGLSIGDVAKKLGEMWNNTVADDKQPYEKAVAKLKEN